MIRYLLDTDICIYINNNHPESVVKRMRQIQMFEIGISSITVFELVHGALKSQKVTRNLNQINQMRQMISVLDLDTDVAEHAAKIRRELEAQGTSIGPFDILIAGQALSLNAILVTNNTREFSRVNGLKLENWAEDSA
jgi:tRNA(fMet)-specific endonuclease VapC